MRAPTNSILISILTWIFIFNNLFHRIRNSQSDENHFVAVFFFFFFSFVKKCHCYLKSLWIVITNVSREEALRESTVKLPKSNAGELRFSRKKSSSHNCACVKWNNVARWNHRVRVARAALHCDLGIFCTLVSSRTIEEIRNVLCFQISNTSD